jgi:hypothetical protein
MADTPHDENINNDEAAKLLNEAGQAHDAGQDSLAFHLYLAAFEVIAKRSGQKAPAEGEAPLRKAWSIALAMSDRRCAESALEKLMPYLSPNESAECAQRLAQLAQNDLSNLGIDLSSIPQMVNLQDVIDQLPPELSNMIDTDELSAMFGGENGFKVRLDDEGPITNGSPVGASEANSGSDDEDDDDTGIVPLDGDVPTPQNGNTSPVAGMPSSPQEFLSNMFSSLTGGAQQFNANHKQRQEHREPAPKFSDVPGFMDVKKALQSMGIGINPDSDLGKQAQSDLLYHGIDGFAKLPSVIIHVPEGTDCSKLVHAAAGEMGVPFGQISIKLAGPQRRHQVPEVSVRVRGDFGPMRPGSDTPTSGVLLLDGADEWPEGFAAHSRRLGDYISTLAAQPGIAIILTVTGDNMPPRDLCERLGEDVYSITALPPQVSERYDAWTRIAQSHPSARNIDVALLAMVSDGMLPDTFEQAVRDAATEAWRQGLQEGKRLEVSTIDVLGTLADLAPDEDSRERILSVIDEQWRNELDKITMEDLGGDDGSDGGDGYTGDSSDTSGSPYVS